MNQVIVSCALVTLILAGPVCGQKTLRVPEHYGTIQAAIDAAADQDTVLVAPGTYRENIDFKGKTLQVVSREGPHVTIIDGGGQGSVVTFVSEEKPGTRLAGFTLTRGKASYGGGVYCAGKAAPVIADNIILRNSGTYSGGGIYATLSTPVIHGNAVHHNKCRDQGGGIAVYGVSTTVRVVVSGNRIFQNRANDGGGLYCEYADIVNNVIFSNRAKQGAGIKCHLTNDITGNTIVANTAHKWGAGIYSIGGSSSETTRVTNCIFWGNAAPEHVQAPDTQPSDLSVSHCLVQHGLSWGTQILDRDPLFVEPAAHDYHLRMDSPAIDQGTDQAPAFPVQDMEGDPRKAGAGVDLGADEAHPHLHVRGYGRLGEPPEVCVIGRPGDRVYFTTGSGVLTAPVMIPGLGLWHLKFPVSAIVDMGLLPAHGFAKCSFTVPPGRVGEMIPLQAVLLSGTTARLSNLAQLTDTVGPRVIQVPSEFQKIQAALDAARDGDAVLVAPGVYEEVLDFKGKAVFLKSRDGARVTTIDGKFQGKVVTFKGGEYEDSVLDGFTITGGWGGVRCQHGSFGSLGSAPIIQNNRIVGNRNTGIEAFPGNDPVIRNNLISGNTANYGGGVLCGGLSQVVDNDIEQNSAPWGGGIHGVEYAMISRNRIHHNVSTAHGGGLYLPESYCWLTHNRIYRNKAEKGGGVYSVKGIKHFTWNLFFQNTAPPYEGSAVYVDQGALFLRSCILWENSLSCWGGYCFVNHCDVQGGASGTQNIDADPRFVDAAGDDFHLTAASPCLDKGEPSHTAPFDFEGDSRRRGSEADIGPDEFAPHLYHTGQPTPGGTVTIKVVGPPGRPVFLAVGSGLLSVPTLVPSWGLYYLVEPVLVVPLGPVPSTGVRCWPVPLPAAFPRGRVHLQALVGSDLTRPEVIHVQ